MLVNEILLKATEVLQTRGFCQGVFVDSQRRVCARGAIHVAAGHAPGWGGHALEDPLVQEAETKAGQYLFPNDIGPGWPEKLARWANEPGRTTQEVMQALIGAANG